MITEASFENFKSIKKMEKLNLKPLTIFTGFNASGKSTILEGIGLFAEAARHLASSPNDGTTLERILTDGNGIWKYPLGELQNFVVYKREAKNKVRIETKIEFDDETKQQVTEALENYSLNFPYGSSSFISYIVEFKYSDKTFSQILKIDNKVLVEIYRDKNFSGVKYTPKEQRALLPNFNPEWIFDDRVFDAQMMDNIPERMATIIAKELIRSLKNKFQHVYFISGERGKIDAQLTVANIGRMPQMQSTPSWVGYRGEHVIEMLSRFFTREQRIAKKIQEWGNKFQIPEVRAGYVGEGKLETNFVDPQYGTSLNAALAGLGSRQILPIIVQIFAAESGSTIMVEEPEISLHPESQVLLDELFAAAITEGKQVICTTHSPFMILSINRVIKKGLAKVDDIAIYHVEKTHDEGTTAKKLELNKNGFLEEGVPSFMKTEQDLLREWTDTLEE